jgi:ATP-dependent RNA helicase HelY
MPRRKEPLKLATAREALLDADANWKDRTCYNCNRLKACRGEEKDLSRLRRDMDAYQQQIDAVRSRFWNHFTALRTVLERAAFIRGRELLPRGIALANLRTQNELLAAETLASGLLEGLAPEEMCAVVCMMIAEPPRGRMAWHPLQYSRKVDDVNRQMYDLATHLAKIEKRVGDTFQDLNPSIMLASEYAGLVQHWAAGFQWAHIVETSGIDEGQLVRQIRHVIDMLNQIKDVPGNSPSFIEKLNVAIAAIDRDIVREVF